MQFVLSSFLVFFLLCQSCFAEDYISGRHIWIWQEQQIGEAVEDGIVKFTFRIISGLEDSRFETPIGDFQIQSKGSWRHNNHAGIEMPLPMYFYRRYAIHGWSRTEPFPGEHEASLFASHGCISVDQIERLYNWAPIGTPVHVRSERIGYN